MVSIISYLYPVCLFITIIYTCISILIIIALFKKYILGDKNFKVASFSDIDPAPWRSKYPLISIIVALICLFVILFNNPAFTQTINYYNLELSTDGYYCYYVELENKNGKTYILPAGISIYEGEYHLDCVYWSNGGYLSFRDAEIEIEKQITLYDKYDDKYKCTLLNKHAYTDQITETKASAIRWIELFVSCVSIILGGLCFTYNNKSYEKTKFKKSNISKSDLLLKKEIQSKFLIAAEEYIDFNKEICIAYFNAVENKSSEINQIKDTDERKRQLEKMHGRFYRALTQISEPDSEEIFALFIRSNQFSYVEGDKYYNQYILPYADELFAYIHNYGEKVFELFKNDDIIDNK